MEFGLSEINILQLFVLVFVPFFGGFIKGVTGFGFPMIMISGLGVVFDPELAVSFLLFALLVVNALQMLQFKMDLILKAFARYFRITATLCLCLFVSAPLVLALSKSLLFLILGFPITVIALLQLRGWKMRLPENYQKPGEYIAGVIAGFGGGFAGVWAPLVVTYLLSLDIGKRENILAQGVIYSAGSVILIVAHFKTEVLNYQTIPMSLLLIVPSVLGLFFGIKVQNRLDSDRFRQCVQVILVIAGLNLIVRGLW
ncbi:MAG: sulfite exporter TauE/SafE family protein [Paracoccaceae bacterium]|nr:sulfite exporter TauE/SafE family protein [Paracoccaceae bacterium]MDE2759662.1 sulfite exporter TauE/SafE family protein [Paracoccaceae bacterium]MDE2917046.1 sulfite exporter TauE/SafE family protein [Paracoccaceae bacterium]